MNNATLACGLSLALVLVPATRLGAVDARDHAHLKLIGCVVAGEEKNSFLLTDTVITGDDAAKAPAGAFFRFDSVKGLKEHVGERVEISGTADLNDVDKGTLKVKTDNDGKTTASIDSERQTVKAQVGAESGLVPAVMAGSEGSMKTTVATYKFKLSGIKTLAASCR